MSNPIRNAIADFTLGQIAAPRVPTPTIDSPRMNIDYRQYPFGYGTSQATASASSYTSSGGSGPGPYRGPLDVMGMTQSVENQFVGAGRALSGAMSTVGLSSFMGIGSAMSMANLQRIENKIAEGEAGYALGMFNNRIIGVSPGLFGGYTLSGVLPEGLTPQQRNQLTSNLLSLREAQDNPKDFAVAPQPTVEPTQKELASSAKSNIVYDDKGNPVKVGGKGPDTGNFVTTKSGQYVSQDDLEQQNIAYQNTQSDDSDDNNNTGTQYSFSDLVPDEDDDFIDDNEIGVDDSDTEPGDSGCCFIMLEARYGDGTMDEVVRRYRDEHMTVRNKRGYYKVAEVLVPLMRKSRLAKWLVIKTFADPLVSYGKYYYGQNKHGVIFAPVKSFWMSVFNIVGGETEFIRENGKVV